MADDRQLPLIECGECPPIRDVDLTALEDPTLLQSESMQCSRAGERALDLTASENLTLLQSAGIPTLLQSASTQRSRAGERALWSGRSQKSMRSPPGSGTASRHGSPSSCRSPVVARSLQDAFSAEEAALLRTEGGLTAPAAKEEEEEGNAEAGLPKNLPKWAYPDEVRRIAIQEFSNQPVPMGLAVGPAVRMARWCTALLWLGALLMPVVAYEFMGCTDDGFATRSPWHWLFYLPLLVASMILEYKCVTYTVLPFIQVTKRFKLLNISVSYKVWLAWTMVLSVLNKADIASDSVFLAATLKSETCGHDEMTSVWRHVKSELPVPLPSHFSDLVLIFYLLMFLQLIYPLLESTPRCGQEVDYSVGTANAAKKKYLNYFGHGMNLGDTLMILGEAAQMSTLQSQNPAYPRAKELYAWGCEQNPKRCLSFLRNALSRGIQRLGLVAVLENTMQIILQTQLLAMNFYIFGREHSQVQACISIALSLVMSISRIYEFWQLRMFYGEVSARVMKDEFIRPRLTVVIHGAHGLPAEDVFYDPYCECETLGKPETRFSSKICYNTDQPVWNTKDELIQYGEDDILRFTVRDQEDIFLGEAEFNCLLLSEDGCFSGELPLAGDPCGASPGALPRARLRVTVSKSAESASVEEECRLCKTHMTTLWIMLVAFGLLTLLGVCKLVGIFTCKSALWSLYSCSDPLHSFL